jgi:outer membrane protein TolC
MTAQRTWIALCVGGSLLTSGCANLGDFAARTQNRITPPIGTIEATTNSQNVVSTNDTVLLALIARLSGSPQVAQAEANLAEAIALARAARAGLLPSLTANLSGTGTSFDGGTQTIVDGQVNLSVPLDFAGNSGARAGAALATAQAQALQIAAVRRIQIGLITQALTDLRAAQVETALRQAQLTELQRLRDIAQDRLQAGLETGRSNQAVALRSADLTARIAILAQSENLARRALELASGAQPNELDALLQTNQPTLGDPVLPNLDVVPAKIIDDRPDVAFEARLVEATLVEARGARGDRWPQVSLSAVLRQLESSGSFGGGAAMGAAGTSVSLTGSLLAPLFDFGRLKSLEQAAKARAEAQTARYRLAVLTGFNDIARERTRLDKARLSLTARDLATDITIRDQDLATARRAGGLTTGTPVREAALTSLEAQIARANARAETTRASWALVTALGFGIEAGR